MELIYFAAGGLFSLGMWRLREWMLTRRLRLAVLRSQQMLLTKS